MKRTQIQLTEEQSERLRGIAAAEDRSIADVIRESVDAYVASSSTPDREELKKRSLAAVGRFRSGVKDLARRHDQYVAEAFEDWKSS